MGRILTSAASWSKREEGSILTEFATMMPLLFFLVTACFESGFLMNYYSTLRDTVHSGAKFAAGVQNLEAGTDYWPASCGSGIASSAHAKIHSRVIDTLAKEGITLNPANTCLSTSVTSIAPYTDVTVSLQVDYNGQLFNFNAPRVAISQTTPYLMD